MSVIYLVYCLFDFDTCRSCRVSGDRNVGQETNLGTGWEAVASAPCSNTATIWQRSTAKAGILSLLLTARLTDTKAFVPVILAQQGLSTAVISERMPEILTCPQLTVILWSCMQQSFAVDHCTLVVATDKIINHFQLITITHIFSQNCQ